MRTALAIAWSIFALACLVIMACGATWTVPEDQDMIDDWKERN